MEGGGYVDDACIGAFEEVGHGGLDGVEGAEDIDVHDGLESIGAHGFHGDKEVACCSGTIDVLDEPVYVN